MISCRGLLGAIVLFAGLTAALTWPQVLHPGRIPDNVDAYFSLWRLSWVAHQLPRAPGALFDANIYYPRPNTLAYSDATLLEAAVAAPFLWLSAPVVFVYNLLVLASFVACGVAMFLLSRHLTGSTSAAALAGIVFAFASFRFDHYYHLELLWAQWMPLALLLLHKALASGRWRHGIGVGVTLALQTFSSIYYGVFFATALGVLGMILWAGAPKRGRTMVVLGAGVLLAAVLVMPYAYQYRQARLDTGERRADEALLYSAGPRHYLATTPENRLYGGVMAKYGRPEKRMFPGLLALVLVAIACWPPLDRVRVAYAATLVVIVLVSFGPPGLLFEWLREHVLPYRGLRVPARAGHVALLLLATLSGFGAVRVLSWTRARDPRVARVIAVLLPAIACLEYAERPRALVPVERRAPDVYRWLDEQPAGVVAEFPMPRPPGELPLHEGKYEYYSTFHWRPLVNGYSGNYPPSYIDLLLAEEAFPAPSALAALRAAGVTYLIVHGRYLPRDRFDEIVRTLGTSGELAPYGPFVESVGEARAYRFVTPPPARASRP
jgi:hypothetical protein